MIRKVPKKSKNPLESFQKVSVEKTGLSSYSTTPKKLLACPVRPVQIRRRVYKNVKMLHELPFLSDHRSICQFSSEVA